MNDITETITPSSELVTNLSNELCLPTSENKIA